MFFFISRHRLVALLITALPWMEGERAKLLTHPGRTSLGLLPVCLPCSDTSPRAPSVLGKSSRGDRKPSAELDHPEPPLHPPQRSNPPDPGVSSAGPAPLFSSAPPELEDQVSMAGKSACSLENRGLLLGLLSTPSPLSSWNPSGPSLPLARLPGETGAKAPFKNLSLFSPPAFSEGQFLPPCCGGFTKVYCWKQWGL